MARGQAQAADTQRNEITGIGKKQFGQAGELESSLIPSYTNLMNTGYFNPEEETAARNEVMGAAEAPFGTASFTAANRAGATRNASDLTAQQDMLAREQGEVGFEAANKLEEDKLKNQEAGAYGLGELTAENLKAGESMYGLTPSLLGARAAGGGWSQAFKDVGGVLTGRG